MTYWPSSQILLKTVSGPSIAIAYLPDGKLSPAGLGFLKAKGVLPSQIYKKDTEKGQVIAAQVVRQGQQTKDLLPSILVEMMRAIPFKKRMRWCQSPDTFSRPVRGLVCLYDGQYLPMTYADAASSNQSRGHRYMAPEPFLVTSKDQYLRELRDRFVILSSKERESMFIESAKKQVRMVSAELVEDEELLATVRKFNGIPLCCLG